MKPLLVPLVGIYLLMAFLFFKSWLRLFKKHTDLSSSDRILSRVLLVIATILWPVVVPFAYLELLKQKNDTVEDI